MQTREHYGAMKLYDLFDSLIALRVKFADGPEGRYALQVLGSAKIHEVRTMLDTAIDNARRIIGDMGRPLRS